MSTSMYPGIKVKDGQMRNCERLFESAIRAYMNPIEVREIRFAINPNHYEPEVQFLWMERNGEAKCMRADSPRDVMTNNDVVDVARKITEHVWAEYEHKMIEDDEDLVDEQEQKGERVDRPRVSDNDVYPWKVWKQKSSVEEAYASERRFGKSSAMTATHSNDMYEAKMLDLQRLKHELEIEKARVNPRLSYKWDKY